MPSRMLDILLLSASITRAVAQCSAAPSNLDLSWHPPNATNINNLTAVVNGTGSDGIYNSSLTPAGIPYSTYNWCNM